MKKILYVVSTLKASGPINQLSYIIKYLDKNKFDPIVLTLSPEPLNNSMRNYFLDTLEVVKVETLGLSRLQGLFLAQKKIKQFATRNNIAVVHSQGIRADSLVRNMTIPKVATLRNYPYYDYAMTYGRFKGYVMARLHLNYLKKFDNPVVVSESISKMLKEKNGYTISYVRNGTDEERFVSLDKIELREKLGFSKNEVLFISVGHLSTRKDPITVIKAFKQTRKENEKLIFLGDGPLKQDCIEMVDVDDNIHIMGRVDNVSEYLGASDYFISASLAEGLPNTVMEAMACGVPCLLSDIPPHQEIHRIDVRSSKIFEQKNISDCIDKLEKMRQLDYISISIAAKKIIIDHLNAKRMSIQYQEIYTELVKKN